MKPNVFVVDDDEAVRKSLRWLIEAADIAVEEYGSAQEFLDSFNGDRPGCLLLDLRMPGISGLELQEKLNQRGHRLPTIFVTGYGDIPSAVRAMRFGAVDFIEKPVKERVLLDRIRLAFEQDARERASLARQIEMRGRLNLLTAREREVLELVVTGLVNRQIADRLKISEKTVEYHRANVMEKMQAENTAELTRLALDAGLTCQ